MNERMNETLMAIRGHLREDESAGIGGVTPPEDDDPAIETLYPDETELDEKKPKLGSGGRFKKLVKKLRGRKGVKDPEALAAYIGREKYGKKGFQKLSAGGK